MKILLLNQFFWPDSSATSQLLTDLARALAQNGHDVYTVSADGGYALADMHDAPPVRMYRVKSFPFARGALGRVFSYATFYLAAAIRSMTVSKPDLVITLTTPPLLSLIGNAVKFLRGSRHFIWEMDLYPDVAVDLGYFKANGLLDRGVGSFVDWSRRRADGIIALGECMKSRLVRRGMPANHVFVADNWADGQAISVLPKRGDSEALTVLYSGNLGLAHDIETIIGAIRRLREDSRFRFIFVGGGSRRPELTDIVHTEDLKTVEIRPYVQRATLSESLAIGDIGLVTQREVCCGSVVPSKVYGLLAAGRPILYIGPSEATPARIIREFNCGWHISCGDVDSATKLLLHLAENPDKVRVAGQHAREALIKYFDLPLGVARIADIVGAGSQVPAEKTYVNFPVESAARHSHVS